MNTLTITLWIAYGIIEAYKSDSKSENKYIECIMFAPGLLAFRILKRIISLIER